MSHVHILGVECPDCGQVFVDANQHPSTNQEDPFEKQDVATFKKPTIISRVVNRIFHPFCTTSVQISPGSPSRSNVSSMPRQVYQDPSYTRSRAGSAVKYDKRKRAVDEVSQSGSKASWLPDGTSTYSWKKGRPDENDYSYRLLPSLYSQVHRTPLHDGYSQRSNFQVIRRVDDDNSVVSDQFGSDRLNLKKFVQPEVASTCAVRAWLNEHEGCDPIDSLLTPDLSCDCKNGKSAEKEKEFKDILIETADNLRKMQKSLEEVAGPGPRIGPNAGKKHGESVPTTRESIKAVIGDCSKTRLRILGFLENGSS